MIEILESRIIEYKGVNGQLEQVLSNPTDGDILSKINEIIEVINSLTGRSSL